MKIYIIGCGRILQKHLDSIKILNKKIKNSRYFGLKKIDKNRCKKTKY